jgi:hypothetical protein
VKSFPFHRHISNTVYLEREELAGRSLLESCSLFTKACPDKFADAEFGVLLSPFALLLLCQWLLTLPVVLVLLWLWEQHSGTSNLSLHSLTSLWVFHQGPCSTWGVLLRWHRISRRLNTLPGGNRISVSCALRAQGSAKSPGSTSKVLIKYLVSQKKSKTWTHLGLSVNCNNHFWQF